MPSRKILYLIIALGISISLILFSIQKTAPEAYVSPVSTTSLIVDSSLSRTSGTDTDQDGLKDWEEVLWKTDPNNPDTDGDGVNDGDEVVQGRSPVGQGNLSAKTISGTYISCLLYTSDAADE